MNFLEYLNRYGLILLVGAVAWFLSENQKAQQEQNYINFQDHEKLIVIEQDIKYIKEKLHFFDSKFKINP